MPLKTTAFDATKFLVNPAAQSALLAEAVASGEVSHIAAALGAIARARGMSKVAAKAGVTREGLYQSLSENGDPRLSTLLGVSKALGLRLRFETVALPLDADTERTVRAFMKRLKGRYSVREAILYGSRARQTHSPDSDADIAVILKGETGNRWEMTRELSGIAYDVLLETGVRIQPLPLWEGEWEHPERFGNPALIATIQREGLRL